MKNTSALKFLAIVFAVALLFAARIFAAEKEVCNVVKFKTSAYSWDAKNLIESNLSSMLGVIDSDLDLSSKVLTVQINNGKTNCDSIVNSIKRLGYDAELICNEVKDNKGSEKSEIEGVKSPDFIK